MNLDNREDYYLHDFNNDSEQARVSAGGAEASDTVNTTTPTPVAPHKKKHHFWVWFFIIVILALGATVYIRYFVPYITQSTAVGYVTLVEKRGMIFHTFEGEMVSQSLLADTSRVYSRDIFFSIPNDSVALALQRFQDTGRPVMVKLERFYGTLPWRGASNTILTSFKPIEQ